MNIRKKIIKSALGLVSAGLIFTSVGPGVVLAADSVTDDAEEIEVAEDEVVSSFNFYKDKNGNWIDETEVVLPTDAIISISQPTEIVVAQYTLSGAQTASLAASMRALDSTATSTIIGFIGAIPQVGPILAASLNADRARTIRQEVIDASDNGQRVRVTIYDYEEYSTSYSQRVEYSIIN